MNKRAEVEIAINKRTIERAAFLLIIIVLAVLLATHWEAGSSESSDNLTQLQDELATANGQIESLQTELDTAKDELAEQKTTLPTVVASAPPVAPAAPAPSSSLSGDVAYSWEVDAQVQTPLQYNADKIAQLKDEIEVLEEELDDGNITAGRKSQVNDEIDEKENEVDDLSKGDTKLRLKSVSVTVDNGESQEGEFDYVLCWASFDCTKIRTVGTFSVPSGKKITENVKLTIPSFLQLGKIQVLQLVVTQDDKEVFADEKSFRE